MKKTIKNILLNIVFWTWCLPQTLLGFILKIIYEAQKVQYRFKNEEKIYTTYESYEMNGGISLGKYIILNDDPSVKTIKHEYGHQVQSFILGPLYLLVIGLPSLIWCWIIYPRTKKKYSWFYTEKWADNLGGVTNE